MDAHQRRVNRRTTTRAGGIGTDRNPPQRTPKQLQLSVKAKSAVSTETIISLVATLSIAAIQAMGVTVSPWLAIPCWLGVLYCLVDVIWRYMSRHAVYKCVFSALAILAIGALVYRSIVGPSLELATVAVTFGDERKIPASIPPIHWNKYGGSEALPNLQWAPDITEWPLPADFRGPLVVNVNIENSSNVPLKDATITVTSNKRISSKTLKVASYDDHSLSVETRTIYPANRVGYVFPISVQFDDDVVGHYAELNVTIEATNMKKTYVGFGGFHFTKPQP